MKKLAIALALGCVSFTAFADESESVNNDTVVVVEVPAGDIEPAAPAAEAPEHNGCGCPGKGNK